MKDECTGCRCLPHEGFCPGAGGSCSCNVYTPREPQVAYVGVAERDLEIQERIAIALENIADLMLEARKL